MEGANKGTNEESINRVITESTAEIDYQRWNTLTTVTTFDRGNSTRSMLHLDDISESQANSHVVQRVSSSASILIESLIEQLCTIFEEDKSRRNILHHAICDKLYELELIDGSYNMVEFEALRKQYQGALYKLFTFAHSAIGGESILHIPSCLMLESSRYRREFQEISHIAGGGFGEVFKALHRLDGIEYAVKKIVVHSSRAEIITQHLKEVKTLAKLNHTNIVPYKAAWIESKLLPYFTANMPSTDRESFKSNASGCAKESRSGNSQPNKHLRTGSNLDTSSDDSLDIVFDDKATFSTGQQIDERSKRESSQDTDSDIVFLESSSSDENVEKTKNDSCNVFLENSSDENREETGDDACDTDSDESCKESVSHQELCTYTSNRNQDYLTLFIQMTLCEQTLEQWMRNRMTATPQPTIRTIFRQILYGIDYIHENKIVHHDIKPSNIFISGQLQIHLADFGLACPLQREAHHSGVGTRMYAAPEQLQGKCDRKSDIYSAGIVLTELLIPTRTRMELICIANNLKCGNIPEDFTIEQRELAQLIIQLVQEDPAKRPCTKQLLHDLSKDDNVIITELKSDIHDKDNRIQELQEEIVLLKEKLKILEEEAK